MNALASVSLPIVWADAPRLVLHIVAGATVGIAFFQGLQWNVQLLARGSSPLAAIALAAGRFGLMGGAMALASRDGAMPLLAVAAGVMAARVAVVRHARKAWP